MKSCTPTKVYCLCGKIGSGKSTVARELAHRYQAVIFNLDEIMEPLFGQTLGRERYVKNLAICRDYVYGLADQILRGGIPVVFDFGFWSREERQKTAQRFDRHDVVFIYLEVSDEDQRRRVGLRNESPEKTYAFTEAMLEVLNQYFEEPNPDENLYWEPPPD